MEEYIVQLLDNDECITKGLLTRCCDCENFYEYDDESGIGLCILPEEPFQRIRVHWSGYCYKAVRNENRKCSV